MNDKSEENVVDITIVVTGNAQVLVNGEQVEGTNESPNKLHIHFKDEGDVQVTVNGEDYEKE